jgi:hypothetical protein
MKKITTLFFFCSFLSCAAQKTPIENIIIVTTDGFRWQEVFTGMDQQLAANPSFNQRDSAGIFSSYWAASPDDRRKKLMPFLWSTIATQGQIYGNRLYDNKVDDSNPYWFSYPGYSEIFCGYVDTLINTNAYPANPHTNVLEFINQHDAFKGKVAAFCAWSAFDKILNEKRSGFPVICGVDSCGGKNPDSEEKLINAMRRDSYSAFGTEECLDVYTHYAAMDYLKKKKPRVLYIAYGETDEWAHAGQYKDYLNAAHHVDQWLNDIWNFIQNDPQYKNKTALFITVDHGRGEKDLWTSHNNKIPNSHQTWFAVIGAGIPAKGEIKTSGQLYQNQYAQTFADLVGLDFTCEHPVGKSFIEKLVKE